ncbi:prepilin-type N-terminal cleavage/methylation domain-containing protein [Vibrio splendidus]|uniref:prepilin-type N-terminal cleavage/methylation domain-containing protein n=1 Tax=Vibrio TaxID=662 RepID=UPI000C858E05|nr:MULTISPECIES: prepilin-type N-terminal cleavage/methylation domain-containing protein [Vibrio]MBO7911446.1 prepilin-type N-terminal cleavage/methylation domain-containing protein [Vibrio sp. G41H]MBT9241751.1 prepilin-type N-terminal cleavage/methylation domain-containing protein [Vibrio splendidus]MCF7490885.1 prepilin-type N-terminal cleavage/methylation domain-containing protein [Vibrio sp. G-C-1]MDP2615933.1 prepilin-type N-terminal cleavage/methylation domain-containing protein [Vibrio 
MDNSPTSKGFTLVELIIVIIILAIVSITAVSRMSGRSSFELYALQDQAISVVRQVQVNRMQSNIDSSSPLDQANFQLSANGNCLGSANACSSDENTDPRSDRVMDDGYSFEYQPNLTENILEFDLLGNPLFAASAGVGIAISEQGNTSNRVWVCINKQGFVSAEIGGC